MFCWKIKRNKIAHDVFDAILESKANTLKTTKQRTIELIAANGQNFSELEFLKMQNHDLENQNTLLFITRKQHILKIPPSNQKWE